MSTSTNSPKSLYEVLGVAKSATHKQITSAFRKLAQKLHPDKPGGDKDQYQKIQHAYDILSNERSREHYDLTGSENGTPDHYEIAMAQLSILFSEVIESAVRGDLIDFSKKMVNEKLAGMRQMELSNTIELKKLEKLISRIMTKNSENIFKMVIDSKILMLNNNNADVMKNIKTLETMLEILADYTDLSPEANNPFDATFNHRFYRGGTLNI